MNTKSSKILLALGITNVISPVPMMVFTVLWTWFWFFFVCIGIFDYYKPTDLIMAVIMSPIIISPVIEVLGVVYGLIKIKERNSFLCIILSILGIVVNTLLLYGMIYIGSKY